MVVLQCWASWLLWALTRSLVKSFLVFGNENKGAKPAKKNVKGKAKLMDALGNQVLQNNKKMKISSRTPDSNYA